MTAVANNSSYVRSFSPGTVSLLTALRKLGRWTTSWRTFSINCLRLTWAEDGVWSANVESGKLSV
jgi:hypothetical protein